MLRKKIMVALAFAICFAVAFTAMLGCKKNTPPPSEPEPETPAEIAISPERATVGIGQTVQLTLIGADETPAWSVSDEAIAAVSQSGLVTGKSVGKTYVIASLPGRDELYCEVTVVAVPVPIPTVVLANEIKGEDGYSLRLTRGSSYTLRPELIVGEDRPQVTFSLACTDSGITIAGLTISAETVTDGPVKVIASCEYNGETYSLAVSVTVADAA